MEQVTISPDGTLLALDSVRNNQRTILVQDITARKLVTGVSVGEAKVRNLQWAGDDHLIITTSQTSEILGALADRNEWFTALDLNIARKKLTPLLGDRDMAMNTVASLPVVRVESGKTFVVVEGTYFPVTQELGGVWKREGTLALFKIDLDNDRSTMIAAGENDTTRFVVGADGQPLAETRYDGLSKQWALRLFAKGMWRDAQTQTVAVDRPLALGLGDDGKSVLVRYLENDHYVLREVAPDGTLSAPLPGPSEGREIRDPTTNALAGMENLVGDDFEHQFYSPGDALRWRAILAAFPGGRVTFQSWSNDHRRVVVRVESPAEAPAFALVDLTSDSIQWLGSEYPELASTDISPAEPIDFKAADGRNLTGYLTLPRGREAKKLPLVVLPHGGPNSRDGPGFNWWAQAIASQGYAVLQVNYRGSSGLGRELFEAGFGEWGRKMQTDLSDGVRYLAAEGVIDPARVCIVGADYGGYAALVGATLDKYAYRCAVDVAGPSELSLMMGWQLRREKENTAPSDERYWMRYMGADGLTDPHLAAISPADHADKATIPILLIHGKDDTVVPFEQSQMMADALKKAGKPYEFVVLNHEDHWLSRSDTRLQTLQATVDFLEKNNPPGDASAPQSAAR